QIMVSAFEKMLPGRLEIWKSAQDELVIGLLLEQGIQATKFFTEDGSQKKGLNPLFGMIGAELQNPDQIERSKEPMGPGIAPALVEKVQVKRLGKVLREGVFQYSVAPHSLE